MQVMKRNHVPPLPAAVAATADTTPDPAAPAAPAGLPAPGADVLRYIITYTGHCKKSCN